MVTMILGCPAGGKSSLVQAYTTPNTVRLNRDTEGGSTAGLLPKFVEAIRAGKDVVMDNV